MIDFHSHILPGMDDGSIDEKMSLTMLRESYRQGVNIICATSHFYADEEDPASFLARRSEAYERLRAAMQPEEEYPEILLGAECLYFPGISGAQEMRQLILEKTPFLLVEPPTIPWSDDMLDEIEYCGETLHCIPVIAHIDRYMRILHDNKLFDRVEGRRLLIQVNASFFLYRRTAGLALRSLKARRFQFIGSDCHNLDDRRPNLGEAAELIYSHGLMPQLEEMNEPFYRLLEKA